MTRNGLLASSALRSTFAVGVVLAAASPAFAQQASGPAADQAPTQTMQSETEVESGTNATSTLQPGDSATATDEGQAIVITGSRIRRPNLDSPLPVTSVGGEEFFQTGSVSVGDVLNQLPSLAETFSQSNSTRFLGTSGLNLLDLRGLGTARTLVLVNGRRHVGGDVLSSGVSTDVNTIPADLIERVDVVTGGNSAVYGSDAIAGVVNFILKDHYDGIQIRGQGSITRYKDAGAYFISALAGKNFADGRGNIAVNVEYARQNQAFGDDRKWFRHNFALNDTDAGEDDGNPDYIFNPDFRSASLGNTGIVRFNNGACGNDPSGAPYMCNFLFDKSGNLVPFTGQRIGLGPNGQYVGGNGEGFFNQHQIQIYPQLDRVNVNLIGHFEISPAFVPFVEATYSHTRSRGTGNSGPAFTTGTTFGDPADVNRETFSINNPFLSDQARGFIIDQRALAGLATDDDTRFSVRENLLGLGVRTEIAKRETFRIVGGVRGDIGGPWNYEVSVNYGRLKESTQILGNLNVQRYLLAADAVRDPSTGNIVCRSQIDPAAAIGYVDFGSEATSSIFQQDVSSCVPINIFGGNFTQEQRDYLLANTTSHGRTSQFDVQGFISGDTSQFFNLPGGPVGVVVGGEYREDNLSYDQDSLVQAGYTFYNAIPDFKAKKNTVKEAFGEIRFPILKDVPFFQELEIAGAARVSDYTLGKTGTVFAYNGNVSWSPVVGVRLRGNYARAVRAPNQVELFTPFGQNFDLVTDPCDVNAINNGTGTRAANCAAAGVPAGTAINYSGSLPYLSGGNIDLSAEKSDSFTIGGVITPRFIPGLSVSVDYYSIKVKKAIQFLNAQFILNQCYDSATLANPFCGFFQRAGAGELGHDDQAFGVIDNSLQVTPFNFAKLKTRGIDTEIAYRHEISGIGRLDTRFNYTHTFEATNYTNPDDPKFGDRYLSELGTPKDEFVWESSIQHGPFTLGYKMRYVGKQIICISSVSCDYENFFSFQGRPPLNADYTDHEWYPSRFYHDVRLAVDAGEKYNFYLGIDNLTDVHPPLNAGGIGTGSAIYDVRGRTYYAGFVAKF